MRVAAIDCGTNSIRLLIADIEGDSFREVTRLMEVVRLGQGVDKTGQFHPYAIARTLTAVDLYAAAHDDYLAARAALRMDVPEVEGISAGGMPNRVKCLHSLVAHSLSAGPGVNPLGDEALALLPEWWKTEPCE